MKSFKRWSSVCLTVVLIAGLVGGWIAIQQVGVTPSEAQGITEYGAILAAKLPPKLKAASTPPPEEEQGPPPEQTPRQRPTRESLLEKIRQMPGGKEMLEEAKKRGARLGMAKPVEPGTSLAWMNPFRVKVAEAQSSFSLTLDPSNKWYSSSTGGYAYIYFYGVLVDANTYNGTVVRLYPTSSTWASNFGIQVVKPLAYLNVRVDTDGWYILNFEAKGTSGSSVSMKHYEGGAYSTVASWTYSGASQSCPALLELSAGWHYFYWISSSNVYVYEANVYSL
jgi:hypothetical protein